MIEKIDGKDLYFPQIEIWERNLKEYCDKNKLDFKSNAFYLAKYDKSSGLPKPENIGLILVRIALTDLEGKVSNQTKYVLLQTFYDEGDLSTIDIVKLPYDYHKQIVEKYLEEILTSNISRQLVPLHEGYSRFLTAGGFIRKELEQVTFYGSSGHYLDQLSTYNVNDIASYLVRESGLFEDVQPNSHKGKEYIEKCLYIMKKYKSKPEFYSQLVQFYLLKNIRENNPVYGHIFNSLILMKSIDKAIKEGKEILQVITEEMVEGIGREMMLKGVTERFKRFKMRNK